MQFKPFSDLVKHFQHSPIFHSHGQRCVNGILQAFFSYSQIVILGKILTVSANSEKLGTGGNKPNTYIEYYNVSLIYLNGINQVIFLKSAIYMKM